MHAASIALLGAALAAPDGWEVLSEGGDTEVRERQRPGATTREIEVESTIDAPPERVFRVLLDFERCTQIMPYTAEARVVAREADGKVAHVYTVVDAPLVARRDYTLRLADESGEGTLLLRWTPSDRGPPPREGMVRVAVNEGFWRLEPLDGGKRTRATYRLFTDPGGSLPAWAVNMGNRRALPEVMEAVRRAAADPRYAASP
jgi:uncharacterized protein YndB with AHSA1/START domain